MKRRRRTTARLYSTERRRVDGCSRSCRTRSSEEFRPDAPRAFLDRGRADVCRCGGSVRTAKGAAEKEAGGNAWYARHAWDVRRRFSWEDSREARAAGNEDDGRLGDGHGDARADAERHADDSRVGGSDTARRILPAGNGRGYARIDSL